MPHNNQPLGGGGILTRGDDRCAVHRLLFSRRRRQRSPGLAFSSPVSLGDDVGSGFISLYKQLNINMIIINSRPLFIRTLTIAWHSVRMAKHPPRSMTVPTEISWSTSNCCRVIRPSIFKKRDLDLYFLDNIH